MPLFLKTCFKSLWLRRDIGDEDRERSIYERSAFLRASCQVVFMLLVVMLFERRCCFVAVVSALHKFGKPKS